MLVSSSKNAEQLLNENLLKAEGTENERERERDVALLPPYAYGITAIRRMPPHW